MTNKWLIICRGIAGSGKSTMAQWLVENAEDRGISARIRSTDHYWISLENGEYKFDGSKLGEAHQWNQRRVLECMQHSIQWIIVDNTNTTYSECEPYIEMAVDYKYNIALRTPNTLWAFDVDMCTERNTHNVPKEAIQRMKDRFMPDQEIRDKILEYFGNIYKTANHYEYDLEIERKYYAGDSKVA